jgi:hypothetical protein
MPFGALGNVLVNNSSLTTAAGETTLADFYVEAGVQGLVVDVLHTAAGAGTIVYKIQAYNYNAGLSTFTESFTTLLTSAAIAKDVGTRLVVDPRVTAVANTHASTVLGYRIRIRATASADNATGLHVSATQVP